LNYVVSIRWLKAAGLIHPLRILKIEQAHPFVSGLSDAPLRGCVVLPRAFNTVAAKTVATARTTRPKYGEMLVVEDVVEVDVDEVEMVEVDVDEVEMVEVDVDEVEVRPTGCTEVRTFSA